MPKMTMKDYEDSAEDKKVDKSMKYGGEGSKNDAKHDKEVVEKANKQHWHGFGGKK